MKKYKVTQEFIDELEEWKRANFNDEFMMVNTDAIADFSEVINNWWYSEVFNDREQNKRLVAIINWVNGEDVFEIGTQKYIVRIKENKAIGGYKYLKLEADGEAFIFYGLENATIFDDFEKASEWANKHFEAVEIYE